MYIFAKETGMIYSRLKLLINNI